jgi:hypothetical protein
VADWYQSNLVDTGRSAALWLLLAFLVTFAITRRITLRIHARGGAAPPTEEEAEDGGLIRDIHIGGVHVHHQVWGILLVMTAGLLQFRYAPESPWQEVLAVAFGAGAALALDEFALWLHLEDVYWSEEGRKSIDAVMIAVVVGLGMLVGTAPLGLEEDAAEAGLWFATLVALTHIAYTVVCLLKGKVPTGLIGLVVPTVSVVGAVRLAKPSSYWARRFYGEGKMARAERRGDRDDRRREAIRTRLGAGSANS